MLLTIVRSPSPTDHADTLVFLITMTLGLTASAHLRYP